VACNLVAFGCKLSKELGFDGVLPFDSKTALIAHYEKLLERLEYVNVEWLFFKKEQRF